MAFSQVHRHPVHQILLLLATWTLCLISTSSGRAVTVSNVVLRNDTEGRVVNSHDGCLVQLPTSAEPTAPLLYYQYGTVYEPCHQPDAVCDGKCGYFNNTFSVYSTPDLVHWTLLSANVLPELTLDNDHISYWEANVGFNNRSNQYVMIYWSGHYGFINSSVAVAVSKSPAGPFRNVAPIVARGAAAISDTVAMFVDDDGTAYVRYNTWSNPRQHIVERLTDDWLASTGEFGVIFSKPDFPWYDGGGMFRRGNTYYVMLSFDCCFCQWGSDALVFVAKSPLGPWQPQQSQQHHLQQSGFGRQLLPPADSALAAQSPSQFLHEQAAAELRATTACNLTGAWSGVFGGQPIQPPNLQLAQAAGSSTVQVTGGVTTVAIYHADNSSLVFPDFPGYGILVGVVGAYNHSADPCSNIAWLDYSPPGSFWCKSPVCHAAPPPPANWTNEVNFCSTGQVPPAHVDNMYINPCSPFDVNGPNFTVPAQQFNVAVLKNASGAQTFLFYGEHFRSASDGLKSHDLQAWIPLSFDDQGRMLKMEWMDEFIAWP